MDYYIGDIQLFPYISAPQNFIECRGQAIPINSYEALFSVIGSTYGGDVTNFCVPNLIGTEPAPLLRYYICTQGLYPQKP